MIDQASLGQMMAVTLRCRDIDFSAVTRDQAVAYVKSQCRGMTKAQVDSVIKNVLGDK
jgi:hypothetical protein